MFVVSESNFLFNTFSQRENQNRVLRNKPRTNNGPFRSRRWPWRRGPAWCCRAAPWLRRPITRRALFHAPTDRPTRIANKLQPLRWLLSMSLQTTLASLALLWNKADQPTEFSLVVYVTVGYAKNNDIRLASSSRIYPHTHKPIKNKGCSNATHSTLMLASFLLIFMRFSVRR